MHVYIHTDAGLAITDRHHQVRRFPADPRQSDQLLDRIGNCASIDVEKATANCMNGFGFRAVEPDGIDGAFDLPEREGQHRGRLMRQREEPGTGFTCRLVFGPEAEEARHEDAKGISVRLARHYAEDRLPPLLNLALHDSKRGSNLILAHGQGRDMKALGGMRSTEQASPWKDTYSGLRFDNHF